MGEKPAIQTMKLWSKIMLLCALLGAIGYVPQMRAAVGCSCTLVWDASPSPGIAGYAVYYGVSDSSATNRYDAGQTLSATITGLNPATAYFFYVVVYDPWGDESTPSNVLPYTTPPISSVQLRQPSSGVLNIQFQVPPGSNCLVEYTPSLSQPSWTLLASAVADMNGLVSVNDTIDPTVPARFYRGVLGTILPGVQLPPQLSATPGFATELQWDASVSSSTTGYTVYYGAVGSLVTNQLNVGSAHSTTLNSLSASTPYFAYVVSYDSFGNHSPPSNLVQFTTPAISPLQISQAGSVINIQFRTTPGATCSVESTPSLNSPAWSVFTTTSADANGLVSVYDMVDRSQPGRFYRGLIGTQIAPQVSATPGLTTMLQWNFGSGLSTVGYAIYYGAVGSSITNRLDVGWANSATIGGLTPLTPYFFYVVAYDAFGVESAPSNLILLTTPSALISAQQINHLDSSAVMVQFKAAPLTVFQVEYTTNLNQPSWTPMTLAVADSDGAVKVTDAIDRSANRLYRGFNCQRRFRIA
jgi:hypothetical protein